MPDMLVSPELYRQFAEVYRWYRSLKGQSPGEPDTQQTKKPSRFPAYAVIIDAELAGASLLAPSSCLATICEWDDAADTYAQTAEQIAVWNHSAESHDVDTPGAAIPIDGHYWFFGDCEAMDDRPAPPGGP